MSASIQPYIQLTPGALFALGQFLDAEVHAHHSIQLVWPLAESTCVVDSELTGPVLIGPSVPHQLNMKLGWVILVEPQCALGKTLMQFLDDRDVASLDDHQLVSDAEHSHTEFLASLFTRFGAERAFWNLINETDFNPEMDSRIATLLSRLNTCFEGECLKPDHWRAEEIAREIGLSESRFLHLFREQMGIAWRPYLLWRRLMCAVNSMLADNNATEAAYLSGFSDSAHLSRTFKKHFGLTIRDAHGFLKN